MTDRADRRPRRRLRLLAGLLAGAALVAAAAPAQAFKLFGYSFFESDAPPPSPDAQTYTVTVTVANADDDLASRVRAASTLYDQREETPPPSTPAFLSRARTDYERVLAALYANARYGGTLAITVGGRPVETIAADAVLPHPVAVAIAVDAGPPFVFGAVSMAGRAPGPHDPPDRKVKTPERLGLAPGQPARSEIVLQSEQALIDEWRRLGHPKAKALPRTVTANHRTSRLDVAIGVDPGPAAVYGAVEVTGTERMDPAFVVRQTGLTPGERYDPAELELANRRLRHLQVFSSQRLVEADAIAPDGTLGLTVAVAERPLHVFGAGASYSTTDGAGIETYWEHRNLFGQAERLRLEARVAGINSVDPRDFTYLAGVTFVKPGVFTPMTDLTVQVLGSREVQDTYTQTTLRGRVGLAHEFSEHLTGKIAVNGERDRVDDAFGKRDLTLASLPAELAYDGSDDKLEPTRGVRAKIAVEPFYETEFEHQGLITRLDGSAYVSLDPAGRFVLAARAAAGSIVGAPASGLPADRLFFAGGGGSVRGYDYRSLGPRLPTGAVVGGRSLVEASLELRAKVTDSIGIVPFVDAGQAFATSYPDFSDTIKIGAGLGVRYYTGLGAIRLDVAAPVNPEKNDPAFAIYIGLGEAF